MALEPAQLEGAEGKSGLRSRPCPPPHLHSLAWGILHYLPSSPAAGRSFAASWCLHSSQTLQGFVFLSPFFIPTPSSHNAPQLPTPPFSHSSPLRCPSGFEGRTPTLIPPGEVSLLATIRGCRLRRLPEPPRPHRAADGGWMRWELQRSVAGGSSFRRKASYMAVAGDETQRDWG